jgi:hypothetical protein
MAIRRRNIIIGTFQDDTDDDELFDLFEFEFAFVTFVKTFEFPFLLFDENGIKLFAIGATEFTVFVAIEFRASGTVSVAKSETEFRAETVAFGIVFVAKFETEFRAFGTVCVAKFETEFRAEFVALAALFVALVRLDTLFIAEHSMVLC